MKNNQEETKVEKNSKEEIDKYAKPSVISKLPFWLKALFLKYWYFGAVFFFIGFGLGLNGYWFGLAAGLVGGAFYDIVVRHFLLAIESNKHETKYHIMSARKGYMSFVFNVLYNVLLCYTIVTIIALIKNVYPDFSFGQEPLSYGLVAIVFDALFLLFKWGVMTLIKKNKNKKEI